MIQYKTIPGPVGLTINRKEDYESAVRQCASIIDAESVGGWEFEFIQRIPVTKKAGCLAGLFGKGDTTVFFNMLVFSRDDSVNVGSNNDTISRTTTEECRDEANDFVNANDKISGNVPLTIIGNESEHTQEACAWPDKSGRKKLIIIAAVAVLAIIFICALINSIGSRKDYNSNESYDYGSYEEDYGQDGLDGEASNETKIFCDRAEGVWVDLSELRPINEGNDVIFNFICVSDGQMYWATYYGDGGNVMQIVDAVQEDNDTYHITLYSPAIPEEYLNGPCDEEWYEFTAIFNDNMLAVTGGVIEGRTWYTYMGSDVNIAAENVCDYYS